MCSTVNENKYQQLLFSYDFKVLMVGLKNEIRLILAINLAFFGIRKDVKDPKILLSSRLKLGSSSLLLELLKLSLARFAILLTLRSAVCRGSVPFIVPPV